MLLVFLRSWGGASIPGEKGGVYGPIFSCFQIFYRGNTFGVFSLSGVTRVSGKASSTPGLGDELWGGLHCRVHKELIPAFRFENENEYDVECAMLFGSLIGLGGRC